MDEKQIRTLAQQVAARSSGTGGNRGRLRRKPAVARIDEALKAEDAA